MEPPGRHHPVALAPDAQDLPQHRAEREIRGRGLIHLAPSHDHGHVQGAGEQFLDQPGLADPGLPDQLDDAPMAPARLPQCLPQEAELFLSSHEREVSGVRRLLALSGAEREGLDRAGLALDHEGLQRLHLEEGRRPGQHRLRHQNLARLGLAHHAGGEVHRVTLHGIGPPKRRTEVSGEDPPAVDAHPKRQGGEAVRDAAHRVQHPRFVRAGAAGRPRHEHDLPAVLGDVRLEERHAVPGARFLNVRDEATKRGTQLVRPPVAQVVVGSPELDEGDGDVAVLRLPPSRQQVLADAQRQAGR